MRKYVYSDVDKGMNIDSSGNVRVFYDVEAIIQSLKMLIGGFVGEYPRSLKGSRILAYIGRPVNEDTAEDIEDELINVITTYEPRVEIIGVNAVAEPDQNSYSITIRLRVRKTGEVENFTTRLRALSEG